MKTIRVVAAVICDSVEHKTKIFSTARGYGEFKGGWEFPGGKIEAGETPHQAVVREIREELDATVRVGDLIDTIEYDYPAFHLSMDCFWCEVVSGELKLLEAEAARWLTKEELDSVEWLPADVTLIDKIRRSMEDIMTHEQFEQAAQYWNKKEKIAMPKEALEQAVEKYIQENNTCALATGSGDYVRCTPIEYSYHDGKLWMFSEGGEKFIGLEKNANVSLAIFDKYDGFGNLRSLQIMGRAEIIEPFSDRYNAHAEYKRIPLEALKKLENPMKLICVTPVRIDVLFSDLKKSGYSIRQTLDC